MTEQIITLQELAESLQHVRDQLRSIEVQLAGLWSAILARTPEPL